MADLIWSKFFKENCQHNGSQNEHKQNPKNKTERKKVDLESSIKSFNIVNIVMYR